jgi:hypothetical protein
MQTTVLRPHWWIDYRRFNILAEECLLTLKGFEMQGSCTQVWHTVYSQLETLRSNSWRTSVREFLLF